MIYNSPFLTDFLPTVILCSISSSFIFTMAYIYITSLFLINWVQYITNFDYLKLELTGTLNVGTSYNLLYLVKTS